PWIRPPVEVYYLNNPLNTVNGIEFLFQFPVGPGVLSLQPYFGSNRDDVPNTGGAGFFEAERIRGIDIKYSGNGYTAHASSFACDVKIYGGFAAQANFGAPTLSNVNVDLSGEGKCEVNSAGFNLEMRNVVVYAEWQNRLTNKTLARPFGDQEAWYTTVGYRYGKWLPHITFAAIDGRSSDAVDANGNKAVTCADATCGGPGFSLMNFPVALQHSTTYGLRYELNDSAALKIEHSIVYVEQDANELAGANQQFNFGLFDTSFTSAPPMDSVGVTSIALDVVF
ncbi:MAG: hypothetical protein OEY66_11830, partial [Gammaproteobacteria bacterium]|nr:hypothetical protein [Gammaproteobacteria bacterium]